MTIEDVQYLLEHSTQDSSMVFIDSSKRNRSFFATPSEYVVDFDEPMKAVFGMDVLDATIPGTMYNVDTHNNRLTIMMLDSSKSSIIRDAGRGLSDHVDVQEDAEQAAISCEMYALGFNVDLVNWLDDSNSHEVLVLTNNIFKANLPALQNTGAAAEVPVNGKYHAVLVRHVISGIPLYKPQGSGAMHVPGAFVFRNQVFAVLSATEADNAELVRWITTDNTPFALIPSKIGWMASSFAGVSKDTQLFDIVYYRALRVTAAQHTSYLSAVEDSIVMKISIKDAVFEPGNYTVSTMLLQLQEKLREVGGIDASSTSSSTVDKQGIVRFLCARNTRFLFCISASTAGDLLGFDLYADTTENALRKRRYNAIIFGDDSRPLFMSVAREIDGSVHQVLDAPGLMNLLGVRYITLRCQEIEQHIGSIGKYSKQSTGIGVFKLASANEVAQLRFDFVSLIRKPFHPIGRLTRMSLRFEMTDGTLYDFKGINHQLLVTIKYYIPAAKPEHIRSVLNPDYDPDFMSYISRQQREAARALDDVGYPDESDDEDDGEHFDDDSKRRVLLEMYKNEFLSR
jgi:hypothetical protein